MTGTAKVTINENQWNVEVASTYAELTTGLSGRTSLIAGTGMLFTLPARHVITVQTNKMLFSLDIIFIKDNLVLDVARDIEPGYLVEEATPCDSFLEVNAGEAELVEVGDTVDVELLYTILAPGLDIGQIIAIVAPLAVLGLVVGMVVVKEEHHSIYGPERDRLVRMYGSWSVGRAESICPEGDVECVRSEAARLAALARARTYSE